MKAWHRDRQEWAQAVRRAADLSPMARLVGQALALDFANGETGRCNPSRETLAAHLGCSEATIKRALHDLIAAEWLMREGNTARKRTAHYRLLNPRTHDAINPGKVVSFPAERRAENRAELTRDTHETMTRERENAGQMRPATNGGTRVKSAPNAGQICTAPYKGLNQVKNQDARAAGERPACPVPIRVVVKPGDRREAAWNEWLTAHGWPTVAALGIRASDAQGAGYAMPLTFPPKDGDRIETRITERFLSWATARMIERREGVA